MLLATIVARYPRIQQAGRISKPRPSRSSPLYPSRVIALVNDPATAQAPEPVRVGLLSARQSNGASAIRGELLTAALQWPRL